MSHGLRAKEQNISRIIPPFRYAELMKQHPVQGLMPKDVMSKLKAKKAFYGQLDWLRFGQRRDSMDLAASLILEAAGDHAFSVILDENASLKERAKLLREDKGQALLPLSNPIKFVLAAVDTPEGAASYAVIVDGHHHFQASRLSGAKTAPMMLWEDLRTEAQKKSSVVLERPLTDSELERLYNPLWKKGYAHPFNNHGELEYPRPDLELQNDPNRYLASLLTVKLVVNKDGKIVKLKKAEGGDIPVLIKIRSESTLLTGSLPFQELNVSDVLRGYGLVYDPVSFGDDVPRRSAKRVRQILLEGQKAGDPRLKNVLILTEDDGLDELDDSDKMIKRLQPMVDKWLASAHVVNNPDVTEVIPACEYFLKASKQK